jgi:thioesterase-3
MAFFVARTPNQLINKTQTDKRAQHMEIPLKKTLAPTLLSVSGFHVDLYGHVNHARYLEFFEAARWDCFRQLDVELAYLAASQALIVAKLELDYRRAAVMGDSLAIQTRVLEIGRRKVIFQQTLTQHAPNSSSTPVCVQARIEFIIYDKTSKKAVSLNDELKDILTQLLPP